MNRSQPQLPALPRFDVPPLPDVAPAVTPALLSRLHHVSHQALQRLHNTRGIPRRPLPEGQRFTLHGQISESVNR